MKDYFSPMYLFIIRLATVTLLVDGAVESVDRRRQTPERTCVGICVDTRGYFVYISHFVCTFIRSCFYATFRYKLQTYSSPVGL